MITKLFYFAIACILIMSGCQQQGAQTTEHEPIITQSKAAQVALVKKTAEELNRGLVNKDKELLDRICAEGLSYGHSGNLIQNKQAFMEDVINGPFQFLSLKMEDQTIEVFENLAIERHIFDAKGVDAGDTVLIRIGTAHLYKLYEDGSCKLVMRQGFKLPEN